MEKGRARSEDTGRAKRAVARRNMVAERGVARVSQGRREREWVCVVWRRVWGRSGLAGIGMG